MTLDYRPKKFEVSHLNISRDIKQIVQLASMRQDRYDKITQHHEQIQK